MQSDGLLSVEEVMEILQTRSQGFEGRYLAMYSSWYGGYVTQASLMLVPIDDHMVHRGDGVFEAFRVVEGCLYDLKAHLSRLKKSADMIQLELPSNLDEIAEKVVQTAKLAQIDEAVVRLYVSRGPGGFSTNPYESVGSQLYIVVTAFEPLSQEMYERGGKVMLSQVPPKLGPYAQIKSCNYLPNVMMKKEAVDHKMDFSISLNEDGTICEGSTENIFIVTKDKKLLAPKFDYTLQGTTLQRVMDLAKKHLVSQGKLKKVEYADLTADDIKNASEVGLAGTTLGVFPIVEFDEATISEGRPGALCEELKGLLRKDMVSNKERCTPIVNEK